MAIALPNNWLKILEEDPAAKSTTESPLWVM
jgi:hypothetical protein